MTWHWLFHVSVPASLDVRVVNRMLFQGGVASAGGCEGCCRPDCARTGLSGC